MNRKKMLKAGALVLAVFLIAIVLRMYVGFFGDPIRKGMASRDMEQYIKTQ